jgi:hypothetical protein
MQKYLVIAYNHDQQQWSWDCVEAETAEDAVILVCRARPLVVAAHAASAFQLEEVARDLKSRSISRIVH